MFCDVNDKQCRKKYPKLKVKAAESVACIVAFLHLWQQKMDHTNKAHVWIKLSLQASADMDIILKRHSAEWKLTPEVHSDFMTCTKTYSVCMVALQNHYWNQENRKLFQADTFKGHWMLHSAELAQYINPRWTWCYSGESFMSSCKVLMQACLKGRGMLSSLHKFIERYNIALSMDLAESWQLKWAKHRSFSVSVLFRVCLSVSVCLARRKHCFHVFSSTFPAAFDSQLI